MRLIDADKLKKCAIPCQIHNGALTDLCVPLYQIDNAPAEEERPQGEWIIDQEGDKNTCTLVTCPFCGERHCCKMNFCGNCGADMRKGGAE